MDFQDATDYDWNIQKSHIPINLIDHDDQLSNPLLLSPILLGREHNRILSDHPEESNSYAPMQHLDLNDVEQQDVQIDDLENFIMSFPISHQTQKIKKSKKSKTTAKKTHSFVLGLVKEFKAENLRKDDVITQLQKCQQAKSFIDKLERTLLSLKSQMISNIQMRK